MCIVIYNSPTTQRNRAVSDNIGTMIIVAVVFIAAFSIGGFILERYDNSEPDVKASVEFQGNADSSVDVVWTFRGTADSIRVSNGTTTRVISTFGESTTMSFGSEGSPITVIAQAKDGRETFLSRYTPPKFKSSVYARSHSGDSPSPATGPIVFNGSSLVSETGVTILSFGKSGKFKSHAWYNTDSNNRYRPETRSLDSNDKPDVNSKQSCSGCSQNYALSHIENIGGPLSLTNGESRTRYVMIIGQDQPGDVKDSLNRKYREMGAEFSYDNEIQSGDSWILLTKKTVSKESGSVSTSYEPVFEKHKPPTSISGNDSVAAYFYAPLDD